MAIAARSLLGTGALVLLGAASLSAQSDLPERELPHVFPPDTSVEEFWLTPDGKRTYFRTQDGEIRLYDREGGSDRSVVVGPVRNLDVSPAGDALVYVRDVGGREPWVRLLPLDPATGLPAGDERRLGSGPGDVPSFAPDGRRVAYARNDSTGVGQSVVVLPTEGGPERVVAASQPSSIRSIRWTPDGSALYFGVNPPVPCMPR